MKKIDTDILLSRKEATALAMKYKALNKAEATNDIEAKIQLEADINVLQIELWREVLYLYATEMKTNNIKQQEITKWIAKLAGICGNFTEEDYWLPYGVLAKKALIKTLKHCQQLNDKINNIHLQIVTAAYEEQKIGMNIVDMKINLKKLKQKKVSKLYKFIAKIVKLLTFNYYDTENSINNAITKLEKKIITTEELQVETKNERTKLQEKLNKIISNKKSTKLFTKESLTEINNTTPKLEITTNQALINIS